MECSSRLALYKAGLVQGSSRAVACLDDPASAVLSTTPSGRKAQTIWDPPPPGVERAGGEGGGDLSVRTLRIKLCMLGRCSLKSDQRAATHN